MIALIGLQIAAPASRVCSYPGGVRGGIRLAGAAPVSGLR
jgi:hypothetical protein